MEVQIESRARAKLVIHIYVTLSCNRIRLLRPEMYVNIHTIDFGFNQCYIIQSEGTVMVDGGSPNKIEEFMEAMERIPVEPEDTQLIILTHGHFVSKYCDQIG